MGRTITASAPGRCGILGNPSDIYGGKVLACSIMNRNRCTLIEGGTQRPEDTRLLDAVLRRYPLAGQWGVVYETTVPRSSGLAGSTALLAALLACVLEARGEAPDLSGDRRPFAELVRDIERNEAGVMCGYQDAYMVVHGGLNLMDFAGKHPVNPGPYAKVTPIRAHLPFLLVTTGVARDSGSVHAPMSERWLAGETGVVEAIAALPALAEEGAECLANLNWARLAELMKENQRLVAAIGGSGPDVDRLIEACYFLEASAAKLAGAGHGGTVIALTHDPERLRTGLQDRGYGAFAPPMTELDQAEGETPPPTHVGPSGSAFNLPAIEPGVRYE